MTDKVYDPVFKQWVEPFPEPEQESKPEVESIEDWARGILLSHRVNRQEKRPVNNRVYDPVFGQWVEPFPEPEPPPPPDLFERDSVFDWASSRLERLTGKPRPRIYVRYSEDQPRDDHGRFGEGSGESSSTEESGGGKTESGSGSKDSGKKDSEKIPQGTPVMPGHPSMRGKTPGTLTDEDIDTMADTLVDRYENCTQEMKDAGAAWYPDAHDLIADVAEANGFTEDQGIAIAAALSPGTRWEPDNIMQAVQFMSKYGDNPNANPDLELNFSGRSTHTNIERAESVMHSEHAVEDISGPKISSFAANLSGDDNRVTIDTWASRAAVNDDDHTAKNLISGKGYEKVAESYRRAAERVGVSAPVMQATVWLHVKH